MILDLNERQVGTILSLLLDAYEDKALEATYYKNDRDKMAVEIADMAKMEEMLQ